MNILSSRDRDALTGFVNDKVLWNMDPRVKPGDDERKKEPGNDKGKGRQYRKEFLLTILSSMLLKKKKRATRKLWHNDDN